MIICKFKISIKIFLKILFLAITAFCVYSLWVNPLKDEYLLAIPLIIACIMGWWYVEDFKIEISQYKIVSSGMKTEKVIAFQEVKKLELYDDHIIIKSNNNRVKISNDLVNQKEAITFILNSLKERKNDIILDGDSSAIEAFKS